MVRVFFLLLFSVNALFSLEQCTVTKKEQQLLEHFFRYCIGEQEVGYVLEDVKPITWLGFSPFPPRCARTNDVKAIWRRLLAH